jgi:hypothetical protein
MYVITYKGSVMKVISLSELRANMENLGARPLG